MKRLLRRRDHDAEQQLIESALFDSEWYAAQTGIRERAVAARDYLRGGASPNPLFDGRTFKMLHPHKAGDGDPFLAYLTGRHYSAQVHPMFETARYLSAHPEALDHPDGPIGHYLTNPDPVACDFDPGPEGLGTWWLNALQQEAKYDAPPDADVLVQIADQPDWRELWWTLRSLRWQRANDPECVITVVLDPTDRFAHAVTRAAATIDDRVLVLAQPVGAGIRVSLKAGVVVNVGWLQPLLDRLSEPDIRAVSPLVLDERGVIRSAGLWADQQLLQGFAPQDADGIDQVAVPGLPDVCLATTGAGDHLGIAAAATVLAHRTRVPMGIGDLAEGDSHWVALKTCGFTDAELPISRIHEQPPQLRWAIKHSAPPGPRGWRWGDSHFADLLAQQLRLLGQQVVIDARPAFSRETAIHDDVNLVLRGEQVFRPIPDRINLAWVMYDADTVTGEELADFDRVYVASEPTAERWRSTWGGDVVTLLQATEPERFHPGLAPPDSGAQVLFVGNSRQTRRPLVLAAAEAGLPLTVYGQDWEPYLPASMIAGQFLPNDQVGAAYRAAHVVLCDHREDMRQWGFLANRLFDAVAAGARVISDDVPGIREVFGDAVQVARNGAELQRIVGDLSVFGDDSVRRARAEQVGREHSFAARAQTMLDDVLELRQRHGAL
ncbi:MAG TPA: glycosyltransferase [Marmoricola sp.]|nr:glycosyltransferase [Marmoricola sp.]